MKKKPELKEFLITASITGRATVTVMAVDEAHAKEEFWTSMDNEDLLEWEWDEIQSVESNE